ncbi:MAG: restriction endonuclease subunit S [Bacteroidales bacterium]|nr:restriction endonuclease subunit S [Bacteroidales bacterium]
MFFQDSPSRARRITKKGDTIISTVRTYLKTICYLEKFQDNLIVSTGFAVLNPNKSIESKYLYYSILSEYFVQSTISLSKGVAYPAINPSDLGGIYVLQPKIEEQQEIVNYLDKQTSKIDKAIQKIQQKINLLEEYKKSLIHHVVTGKADVRGVEI